MDARKASLAALTAASIISPASELAADLTDQCPAAEERLCASEPGKPVDRPEFDRDVPAASRAIAGQLPPPAAQPMPPGRGMTDAMREPYEAEFCGSYPAIRAGMESARNAALLFGRPGAAPRG